jgi:hypothetical protein
MEHLKVGGVLSSIWISPLRRGLHKNEKGDNQWIRRDLVGIGPGLFCERGCSATIIAADRFCAEQFSKFSPRRRSKLRARIDPDKAGFGMALILPTSQRLIGLRWARSPKTFWCVLA